MIFSPLFRKRTLLNSLYLLVSIIGQRPLAPGAVGWLGSTSG